MTTSLTPNEARLEAAKRKCTLYGHDELMQTTGPPDVLRLVTCTTCKTSWTTTLVEVMR